MEQRFAQDVAVQVGYAVDAVGSDHCQVCHVQRMTVDDCHAGNGVAVQMELLGQLAAEAVVDFYDNLIDARQQGAEHILVPAFQRLGHDGVVGVGKGVADNLPRLVPRITALIQQDAHQLRNGKGRVGVVDVDGVLFCKVFQCAVQLHVAAHDVRDGGSHQEVLLTQTQVLPAGWLSLG